MTEAQCELKAAGKPYPRTCPVCFPGPCQRMEKVAKRTYDERLQDAARLLRDDVANRVADLVRADDLPGAQALMGQGLWGFLNRLAEPAPPTGDAP